MVRSHTEARALLESEGWTFLTEHHPHDPLGEIHLIATHAALRITSVTRAASEAEALELLVAGGGP